jgi:hypothetical protein
MWEIPWWGTLIVAWGAGSMGFLLGAVLSLGRQVEEAAEAMRVEEVRGESHCSNVSLGMPL